MTVNKTKPIAITLTNHNRIEKEQYDEPIRISNKYILLDVLLCGIAEYFYELCRILTSPWGESKYKRVKILSDTTQQNV